MAEVVCAVQGPSSASKLVNDLAFGGYNKAFAPNRTGYDWLCGGLRKCGPLHCRPPLRRRCHGGLFRQMLHGIAFNQNPKNLARMDSSLPVLLISGDRDPVGDMGKGVRRTADAFRKGGPVGRDSEAVSRPEARDPQRRPHGARRSMRTSGTGWSRICRPVKISLIEIRFTRKRAACSCPLFFFENTGSILSFLSFGQSKSTGFQHFSHTFLISD